MIFNIYHETIFNYQSIVTFSHNIVRLKPKNTQTQKLLRYSLKIEPNPNEISEFVDYFKNINNFILIRNVHNSLKVVARSKVDILEKELNAKINSYNNISISVKEAQNRLKEYNAQDVLSKLFLFETPSIPMPGKDIIEYVLKSFKDDSNMFDAIKDFMQRVYNDFDFVPGVTDITTPIDIVFKERRGVCQDFAQFSISALRGIGIAAKYMSGYIKTIPFDGEKKLFGSDASHAWVSVYVPSFGWVEFDPTNNKIPNEEYIILSEGRDYFDVAPLKGVVKSSGDSSLRVKVNVDTI